MTAPTSPSAFARTFISHHHPLGASTGYMTELREAWDELVNEAALVSPFAAELAALSEPEFGSLRNYLAHSAGLPFLYLSVHAPIKGELPEEPALVDWLSGLPPQVDAIVVHPDLVSDATEYRKLGHRLVIENMDARKAMGQTAEDLQGLFELLPEAGFCFDIAHAWAVDPTMQLAADLLDAHGPRLRHVHLSSLHDGSHVPLLEEHERLFTPLLARCRDVPWILEAAPPKRWGEDLPF